MDKTHRIQFRSLIIDYRSVILTLHRNFTTAHSTSATRTNFFIRAGSGRPQIYLKTFGFGQCGLPPKKPGCYMSDINDCFKFMQVLSQKLKSQNAYKEVQFNFNLPEEVNTEFSNLKSSLKSQIVHLLQICNQYNDIECYRAPKCALQFSLLDLLTKYHQTSINEIFFPHQNQIHNVYSFYTASLQKNEQMIQNARTHLKITKFIKFKYNNNIKELLKLLSTVHKQNIGDKLIIDANCSWSITDMQQFLENIKKVENSKVLIEKIIYIEQPFNLQIDNLQQWELIKKNSPIKILADESFRNQEDIAKVKKVAHAVNIKTQKAGGPFATLKASLKAKKEGLQVMFGSMCSTQLGCTQTFQFYPLAQYLDIDGALLVKQPQLQGGFQWKQNGKVVPAQNGYGLKVLANNLFQTL